jgi:hypothetical protein
MQIVLGPVYCPPVKNKQDHNTCVLTKVMFKTKQKETQYFYPFRKKILKSYRKMNMAFYKLRVPGYCLGS